ncbi:MAG: hypothetical protein KatS3mg053_2605 [Candidatus Roseilinea sp.]|nr:MAG: hypothetical protein KatS3mg053_2605 [Candidatus Roseilinea sp.]
MNVFATPWLATALISLMLAMAPLQMNAIGEATRPSHNTSAAIIRVALAGNDSPGCGTDAAPCRSIAFAIRQAAAGDEIRIAAGTYTGAGADPACAFLFTAVLCIVDKPLIIRGGFSTENWALSDPVANPTIIDGQHAYRGVNVVRVNRLTIEGITIQNGLAEAEAGDPNAFGGGMTAIESVVTLRDMVFENNLVVGQNNDQGSGGAAAGGALAIRSAPAGETSFIERVTFQDNVSIGGAGADRGGYAFGAVFVFQSQVEIRASTFTGNRAQAGDGENGRAADGSRADALGGAVAVEGNSNVSLIGVQANDNLVVGGNGAQFGGGSFGGGVYAEDSSLTITDAQFRSNLARGGDGAEDGGFAGGGGILTFNSEASIQRVQIIANRAVGGSAGDGGTAGPAGGGGVYLWRAKPEGPATNSITNAIIADNAVEIGRGQITGGGGGGIQAQGLTAEITHVTLARNRLGEQLIAGEALVVVEAPGVSTTTVHLNYSVVADHATKPAGAAIVVLPDNTLNLTRGLFANNAADTNGDPSQLPSGTINGLDTTIRVDSAGFASPGAPQYNYRLTAESPAIDQAIGSATPDDFEGRVRPSGAAPDLGAHEFDAVPPEPPDLPTPRAYIPILLTE